MTDSLNVDADWPVQTRACQLHKWAALCCVQGAARTRPRRRSSAKMLLSAALVSVVLVIFIYKYAFGSSGPNPFETDTREPPKRMIHDRKEKNKVLKQGELKDPRTWRRCVVYQRTIVDCVGHVVVSTMKKRLVSFAKKKKKKNQMCIMNNFGLFVFFNLNVFHSF